MAEILDRQWNPDPTGEGDMVIKVYKETGIKAALRGFFQPKRAFNLPSDVLYGGTYPLTLKTNNRVEVVQGGKVIMKA